MTAVVVNARFFYPDFLAERQSGPINWQEDPDSLIPYEGLRKCDWSRPAGKCLHGEEYGPFGTGQNCGDSGVAAGSGRCRPVPTVPFEFSTDRGLYGGTYVGLIGGAVAATSVTGVLQFDLNANDRFAPPSFPTALIYNSLASTQKVAMNTSAARRLLGPSASADIYETTTDRLILKDASLASDLTVEVPAGQAIIAVAVPAGSALVRAADGHVSVGETVVRFRTPAKTDDGAESNTPRVRQHTPPASWPAPTKGLPVYIFGSNERAYDTTDYLTNMTSRFDLAIYGSPHAAMVPPHYQQESQKLSTQCARLKAVSNTTRCAVYRQGWLAMSNYDEEMAAMSNSLLDGTNTTDWFLKNDAGQQWGRPWCTPGGKTQCKAQALYWDVRDDFLCM